MRSRARKPARRRGWPGTRAVVAAALLLGAAVWGEPFLRHPIRCARLLGEALPARLPVPVDGVAAAALEDTWGAPRGEGRAHQGVDVFAPRGTPVRSATHGIVTRKGWNRLGGWRLLVLGPAGYHHYYAHLDAFAAAERGDWVEQGDVLGYVGTSGNAATTPPHLHYGLYTWYGRAINPYPFLVGAAGGRPR
ncbi:MAG TPA: M23 family metallopeptidase [Thermoanaerobaculia bacterium]|nr:M23 family metallopeptidase [Thermoanaerobaculia bacterium]